MKKIIVKHKIGDIVKNSFNENVYKVVGYNYIETQGLKYIVMQSEKDEFLYMSEIELKPHKNTEIGFIFNK